MNDAGGGGFVIEEESTYDESAYNEPPPGCRECGCLSFDHEYWKAYKVMVCVHCKRIDKYRQVPKGQVKDIFLLTDGDLKHLGFVSRPNPQHKRWSDMRLYLQMQVEEVALRKYGDVEAIRDARQERLQARIADRAAKRKLHSSQGPSTAPSLGGGGGFLAEQDPDGGAAVLNPRVAEARERVRQRLMAEYGDGDTEGEQEGVPWHGSDGAQPGSSRVKKEEQKESKSALFGLQASYQIPRQRTAGAGAAAPAASHRQEQRSVAAPRTSQVAADTEEI